MWYGTPEAKQKSNRAIHLEELLGDQSLQQRARMRLDRDDLSAGVHQLVGVGALQRSGPSSSMRRPSTPPARVSAHAARSSSNSGRGPAANPAASGNRDVHSPAKTSTTFCADGADSTYESRIDGPGTLASLLWLGAYVPLRKRRRAAKRRALIGRDATISRRLARQNDNAARSARSALTALALTPRLSAEPLLRHRRDSIRSRCLQAKIPANRYPAAIV